MSWVDVTTAVGTAGAAVIALGLGGRAEWQAVRIDRKQLDDEHRHQAIHVAAWMLVEQDGENGIEEVAPADEGVDLRRARIYTVVRNGSDEPIWDVIVHGLAFTPRKAGSNVLDPGEFQDEYTVIGPHETIKSRVTIATVPYNRMPLEIDFRDSADREWHRDFRGRLSPGRKAEGIWASFDDLEQYKKSRQS